MYILCRFDELTLSSLEMKNLEGDQGLKLAWLVRVAAEMTKGSNRIKNENELEERKHPVQL